MQDIGLTVAFQAVVGHQQLLKFSALFGLKATACERSMILSIKFVTISTYQFDEYFLGPAP